MLDFLDGCMKERADASARKASASSQLATLKQAPITAEYRDEFLYRRLQAALEKNFDEQTAILFPGAKFTSEQKAQAIKRQLAAEVAKLNPAQLQEINKRATENYQSELSGIQSQIDRQHAEVHDACPIGVGDQVVRGVVAVALSPVTIIGGNIKAMDREHGVIAKAVRVLGPSIGDIEKHGIFGGPNSFFRKPFG